MRLAVIPALSLAVLACSDEAAPPPPPASVETPLEYCLESLRVSGAIRARCAMDGAAFIDAANEAQRVWCELLESDAAAGRIAFDGAAARECLAARGSVTCDESRSGFGPARCEDVLRGTSGHGDTCSWSESCADGWCDSTATCPGVCAPFASLDEDCSVADCADGLVCDGTPRRCVPATPPGREGQPCGNEFPRRCEPGLFCDGSVCHRYLADGEPCSPLGNRCVTGSFCDTSFSDRVCRPYSREGEPCLWRCVPGAVCDPGTSRCVREPVAGEPCLGSEPAFATCLYGASCDAGGTCRA